MVSAEQDVAVTSADACNNEQDYDTIRSQVKYIPKKSVGQFATKHLFCQWQE